MSTLSFYGIVRWHGVIPYDGTNSAVSTPKVREYRSLRYDSADYAAAWCRRECERLEREGGQIVASRVASSRKPAEYHASV